MHFPPFKDGSRNSQIHKDCDDCLSAFLIGWEFTRINGIVVDFMALYADDRTNIHKLFVTLQYLVLHFSVKHLLYDYNENAKGYR